MIHTSWFDAHAASFGHQSLQKDYSSFGTTLALPVCKAGIKCLEEDIAPTQTRIKLARLQNIVGLLSVWYQFPANIILCGPLFQCTWHRHQTLE